jgi:hypothetical protein
MLSVYFWSCSVDYRTSICDMQTPCHLVHFPIFFANGCTCDRIQALDTLIHLFLLLNESGGTLAMLTGSGARQYHVPQSIST